MIRLLYPWNGYPTATILNNVDANTETALIRQGIATADFTGGALSMTAPTFELGGASQVLAQSGQPVIVLTTGTITATGAITGMTALPYVPLGVVKVYVAASAGLTAGLMFARYTSTTACQLFTDSAGTVTPTGLTPGTYTGSTSTGNVLAAVPIPGNLLGPNGVLRISVTWGFTNSANNKVATTNWGGTTVNSTTVTTNASMHQFLVLRNQNNPYSQSLFATANGFGVGGASGGMVQATIDTTQQTLLSFIGGHTNATENFTLEGYTVEAIPAP